MSFSSSHDNHARLMFRIEGRMEPREYHNFRRRIGKSPEIRLDSDLVYPSRRGVMFSIPPPYDVFFQIISGAVGLLTIAKIIGGYLRRSQGKSLRLVFGKRSIQAQGDYTDKELALILRTFSTEAKEKDAGLLSRRTLRKMTQRRGELEKHLADYRALIAVFEDKSRPQLNREQKKKLTQYKRRMKQIRNELAAVQHFIRRVSGKRKV